MNHLDQHKHRIPRAHRCRTRGTFRGYPVGCSRPAGHDGIHYPRRTWRTRIIEGGPPKLRDVAYVAVAVLVAALLGVDQGAQGFRTYGLTGSPYDNAPACETVDPATADDDLCVDDGSYVSITTWQG